MSSKRKKANKKEKEQELKKIFFLSDGVPEHEVNKIITSSKFVLNELQLPAEIKFLGSLWKIKGSTKKENLEKLVRIRVIRWDKFELHEFVSPTEISFEKRKAQGKIKSWGIIYDGFALSGIFRKIISPQDDTLYIVITDRQIATLGEDGRYHLRICVLGNPTLISKHGFFSAPAKPREYHLCKLVNEDLAIMQGEGLRQEIEMSVPLLSRAYVLAGVLWWYEGVGLCTEEGCFLSDSHTTDELLSSKKGNVMLCKKHKKAIQSMKAAGDTEYASTTTEEASAKRKTVR